MSFSQEVHEFFKARLPHFKTEAKTFETAGTKELRIVVIWRPTGGKGAYRSQVCMNPLQEGYLRSISHDSLHLLQQGVKRSRDGDERGWSGGRFTHIQFVLFKENIDTQVPYALWVAHDQRQAGLTDLPHSAD